MTDPCRCHVDNFYDDPEDDDEQDDTDEDQPLTTLSVDCVADWTPPMWSDVIRNLPPVYGDFDDVGID